MNWKLALLSIVFLPSATYPIVKFGRAFRRISTTMQEETAKVSNIIHESITGAPVGVMKPCSHSMLSNSTHHCATPCILRIVLTYCIMPYIVKA
jgi:hypothetical protein